MKTDPKITEALQSAFYTIRNWSASERRLMGVDTLAGLREYVSIELDEVKAGLAKAAAPFIAPTKAELIADLEAQLYVASRVAYLNGATDKQIALIVKLAIEQNDFNILSGSRLTKFEASRIIDMMTRK